MAVLFYFMFPPSPNGLPNQYRHNSLTSSIICCHARLLNSASVTLASTILFHYSTHDLAKSTADHT